MWWAAVHTQTLTVVLGHSLAHSPTACSSAGSDGMVLSGVEARCLGMLTGGGKISRVGRKGLRQNTLELLRGWD